MKYTSKKGIYLYHKISSLEQKYLWRLYIGLKHVQRNGRHFRSYLIGLAWHDTW